ncbi:MAG: VWA domain-containing protein [Thermonemataceae bacterium]|nr:VWA domain-containing protein [Thermonemataceae bacterium]
MKKNLKLFISLSFAKITLGCIVIVIGLWACQSNTAQDESKKESVQTLAKLVSNQSFTDEIELKAGLENPYTLKGNTDEDVYLAIQLKTGKMKGKVTRTPLNVSVVIDQSGSMEEEGKLDFAIKAAEMAIDNLSSQDYLSLVTYESGVRVLHTSQKVDNKENLKAIVRRLRPEGSTFLSGGMRKGYSQVKSTFQSQFINRVLLFSDGLANQGVTDSDALQKIASDYYQEEKIALSTFGLGLGFNEDLMTNLAEYGHGNYYYIDKAQKIPDIFRQEMKGLLSVVAQKAKLRIQFPSNYCKVLQVYGYAYKTEGNEVLIDFNDIFAEEEKVVVLRLKLTKPIDQKLDFVVNFTCHDINESPVEKKLSQNLTLTPTEDAALVTKNINEEVIRHKILFLANEKFELATAKVDSRDYEQAKSLLKENTIFLDKAFKTVKPDSALVKQYKINQEYFKEIETIKEKSETEIKMMQKAEKSNNYMLKKKKIK